MERHHLLISGEVQAVGFRYFAYDEANQLGLTGYVGNLYDSRVEIEVQGDPRQIQTYIKILNEGNGYSKVEDIEVEKIQLQSEENSFRIVL